METYLVPVRDISCLELSAVLTLFSRDGGGPKENRLELAFEIIHWENPRDQDNTTFLVILNTSYECREIPGTSRLRAEHVSWA